jgi:transcriptional regulator of aroF, aroG, tyrA and aromatic amino acid transport
MAVIRWLVKTTDRIGMIQDVVQVFSREGVSISSMEVSTGQIFIKFYVNAASRLEEILKRELLVHTDIIDIIDIALQPYEQREKELQAVLESANEGIIGLDSEGTIRYINSAAASLLYVEQGKAVGQQIKQLTGADTQLLELLTGHSFDNQQMLTDTPRGILHYLCSGRPIRNENNQIIGAVATLKSMKAAQKLVHSMIKSQIFGFNDIIRASSAMEHVIGIAQKVAISDCTVLVRGESGTGKELFARAIHEASSRNKQPFVPINCAALPETLLESELFGYEEGAFSGAKKGGKIGLFEAAHQGTLFLDEIGELSLILQGKLLRAIQEGVIRRVGSNSQIPVDVRIIAATNRNLEEMVETKQFRQDLYYRINVIPITIPPLRERPEDVPLLLKYFHTKYCIELNKNLEFSQAAYSLLTCYEWPGNVRELQNVVLRAIHLTIDGDIEISNLLLTGEKNLEYGDRLERSESSLKKTIDHTEKAILEKALKKYGSARGAAREVGLSHTAVLNKIRRYKLEYLLSSASRKEGSFRKGSNHNLT